MHLILHFSYDMIIGSKSCIISIFEMFQIHILPKSPVSTNL